MTAPSGWKGPGRRQHTEVRRAALIFFLHLYLYELPGFLYSPTFTCLRRALGCSQHRNHLKASLRTGAEQIQRAASRPCGVRGQRSEWSETRNWQQEVKQPASVNSKHLQPPPEVNGPVRLPLPPPSLLCFAPVVVRRSLQRCCSTQRGQWTCNVSDNLGRPAAL